MIWRLELEVIWEDALFHFHQDDAGFRGLINDYKRGLCDFLAIGYEDTIMDMDFHEEMCVNDLVFTDSVLIEIPIALPIREDISSEFSYWMRRAKYNGGITIEAAKAEFAQTPSCNIFPSKDGPYETVSCIWLFSFIMHAKTQKCTSSSPFFLRTSTQELQLGIW